MDDLGQEIQLDLWDTAGQEVFAQLTASYYRGAGACALAFSTIDRYVYNEMVLLLLFFSLSLIIT